LKFKSRDEAKNLEYKYIMFNDKNPAEIDWEDGDNRKADLS